MVDNEDKFSSRDGCHRRIVCLLFTRMSPAVACDDETILQELVVDNLHTRFLL
jgi:hypothetical protein